MANLVSTSTSTNLMPGRGLINPAFVIKVLPATDVLQQPKTSPRPNPEDDYADNLTAGSHVEFTTKKGKMVGMIKRVIKNGESDGIYVEVVDREGEVHKVEASRILGVVKGSVNPDDEKLTSSPAIFAESYVMTFEEFAKL